MKKSPRAARIARAPKPRSVSPATMLLSIWDVAQPLIGGVMLSALYGSAVARAATKRPWLADVRATYDGVDQASLERAVAGVGADEARRGIAEVAKVLLELFESIAGPIILREVLPHVVEAEGLVMEKRRKK